MPPLLGTNHNLGRDIDDVHEVDEDSSETELYSHHGQEGVVTQRSDSFSHASSTAYHSSEENQHDTIVADEVRLGIEYESRAKSSESILMDKLQQQQKLYDIGPMEDYCSDTEKCLQRYFKTIYRQVKFFTDCGEDIKFPNFVIAENSNEAEIKQTVQICNWLLANVGKGHYDFEQKILFWKTYWKMIYKEISKLRMGDTNKFKTRFIKGT